MVAISSFGSCVTPLYFKLVFLFPKSTYCLTFVQGCSLETLVLVSRCLEDMKNGLGLEITEEQKQILTVLSGTIMQHMQSFET